MSLDVQIHGIDELNRKLTKLANTKIAKRIARKAARQAMNIVRDAARVNAKAIDDPETVEKIWKNIAVSGGKTRSQNEIVMRVGVRGGAAQNANTDRAALSKLSGGITTYWRYLEFGSANMPATPFMRPAMSNNIQKVTDKFSQVFSVELDKELAK
ncbi:HK97 gp10 family phage protein [Acinetobacter sp. YH16040_T]|uniref:HK97-gp10 family putative phage morphogenesis protein n=1 Tax=unclassified Acinetobacter TaxID=196816 RepID=UPI0015D1B13D|nr:MULTISPECIES: HK97-gp10 family putative phage morphogenesis protein [unclassified Acinetobacter]UUS56263.1 HK97 gp10 family phage protein [Acinetobacter sp. YH16040_T]